MTHAQQIWVISGSSGEWSDTWHWTQSAWSSEEAATKEQKRLMRVEERNRVEVRDDEYGYYDWKSYHVSGPFPLDPEPSKH